MPTYTIPIYMDFANNDFFLWYGYFTVLLKYCGKSPEGYRLSGNSCVLLEKQRSQLLQAAAPCQELVSGVGRDVAHSLLACVVERLDTLVDAIGTLARAATLEDELGLGHALVVEFQVGGLSHPPEPLPKLLHR